MSKFANLVISAAQYGLAAGAAAQGTKGAAKGASAAGLFFMLLGLSFFLCMDYNSRFGGLGSDLGPGTIIKFLGASVSLTATGFIPYVVISQKSKKFQKAAGGISAAVYIVCSMVLGLVLGRKTDGVAQSVILTNMYVLLGSILGMNAQEAKGNKSAMANAIMSAVGFVLLTLFDFSAPVQPEAAGANATPVPPEKAVETAPVKPEAAANEPAAAANAAAANSTAASQPAAAKAAAAISTAASQPAAAKAAATPAAIAALEKAVEKANEDLEKALEAVVGGVPNPRQKEALNSLVATKQKAYAALRAALAANPTPAESANAATPAAIAALEAVETHPLARKSLWLPWSRRQN